MWLQDTTEDR